MRTCSKCNKKKPLTKEFYHSDKKSQKGFSMACKSCRNSSKRKSGKELKQVEVSGKESFAPTNEIDHEIVNIRVEPEKNITDNEIKTFSKVLQRIFNTKERFFTFQVSKTKTTLAFHGSPVLKFEGEVEDILGDVLS